MARRPHIPTRRQANNAVAQAAALRIDSLPRLTPAERVVLLSFIATPHNKVLALAAKKRPNTIRNQLASAITKLAVETREGLLIFLFTGEKPWLLGENDYGLRQGER